MDLILDYGSDEDELSSCDYFSLCDNDDAEVDVSNVQPYWDWTWVNDDHMLHKPGLTGDEEQPPDDVDEKKQLIRVPKKTISPFQTLRFHDAKIARLRWISVGNRILLAASSSDGLVSIWKTTRNGQLEPRPCKVLTGHSKGIGDHVWSADTGYLTSVAYDKKCLLWDLNRATVIRRVTFPSYLTSIVEIVPSIHLIGGLSKVWIYDLRCPVLSDASCGPSMPAMLTNHGQTLALHKINDAEFALSGDLLTSQAIDTSPSVWNWMKQTRLRSNHMSNATYSCTNFCVSVRGQNTLFAQTHSGFIVPFIAAKPYKEIRRRLGTYGRHQNAGSTVGLELLTSEDSGREYLMCGSENSVVHVYDRFTGLPVARNALKDLDCPLSDVRSHGTANKGLTAWGCSSGKILIFQNSDLLAWRQ